MQRADVENQHPKHFMCPLTLSIFLEPVTISPSGLVYEWEAIDAWIKLAQSKGQPPLCPQTKMPITGYVKAFNIVAAVEEYLQAHPEAKADQYEKTKAETLPNEPVKINSDAPQQLAAPHRIPEDHISEDDRLAIDAAQRELNAEQPVNPQGNLDDDLFGPLRPPRFPHFLDNPFRPAPRRELTEEDRRNGEYLVQGLHLGHEEFSRRMMQGVREKYEIQAAAERQRQEAARQERERLERIERQQREEREQQEREQQEEIRRQTEEAERLAIEKRIANLTPAEEEERLKLLSDLQSLFWSLENEHERFVKYKPAMVHVLSCAKIALLELNPEILDVAKKQYKGKYDSVNVLGIDKSVSESRSALFAKKMGAITHQPGYLVHQIITRVDSMLSGLSNTQGVNHAAHR